MILHPPTEGEGSKQRERGLILGGNPLFQVTSFAIISSRTWR